MSVSAARLALFFLIGLSFSDLTLAQNSESTAFEWSQFLEASVRRFEAQHERQLMSNASSPECELASDAEHFAFCLYQDVFVRQSIESSGLSIEQYARHWLALQQQPKRYRSSVREYQRLRQQFVAINAANAAP